MTKYLVTILGAILLLSQTIQARTWTYEECLDYCLTNNISLQKLGLTRQTAFETLKASEAALFPSLNFTTNQNVAYQPWKQGMTIQNNEVQTVTKKTSYNGAYTLGGNWTVWNGNRNHNQVKLNDVAEQAAAEDSIVKARSLEEQLALLFVRILYSKEAVKVSEKTLEASKVNENRGMEMYRVGSLSKAALSQLTSQRAQDEYNLVQSESNVRNYKRQLKALLQITDEEEFDVIATQATEAMALQPIPSVQSVYEAAVENRPEIKRARLSVESANIQRRIATAQYLPTVTLNASATSNHSSQNNNAWGTQLKNGFNVGGGFSVNVPIFDRREARTAVNKANIQKQQALLDIRDKETTLYSTISDFWIQAYNNQQQYKSAKVSTESAQTSYDLLSEQFQVGLKNIVELQEGKTRLLTAQQSELQAKYTTIYCIKMLEFYKK